MFHHTVTYAGNENENFTFNKRFHPFFSLHKPGTQNFWLVYSIFGKIRFCYTEAPYTRYYTFEKPKMMITECRVI